MTFPPPDIQPPREFWLKQREALLMQVDAIERLLELPRTADLRKELRELQKSVVNLPQPNN